MYLGIDLGGTNLKLGVIDNSSKIVYQNFLPTQAQKGYKSLIDRIIFYVHKELLRYINVKSIGMGVPGLVIDGGIVQICPNLPGWQNINLQQIFKKNFGLPFAVDNDANVGAVAEMEIGAAVDLENFIYVTLGTGVGGTIIINHQIYHGETGGAGEIGHTIINVQASENPERPFRTGILEEFIGKNHIAAYAADYIKNRPESLLRKAPKTDPYFITECAAKGDEASIEIFQNVGHWLGIGLASIMNQLDISEVVIGGGVAESHYSLFDSALSTIKRRALPPIAEKARIIKAKYPKIAGIIGAALLGKHQYETIS